MPPTEESNVPPGEPATGVLGGLTLVRVSVHGPVLHLRLSRPEKRNAISDRLIAELLTAFVNMPADTRAAVISGEGAHFCAGLDLSELVERDAQSAVSHSRGWHAAFDALQFGRVPVVAALQGAVIGGGLELAAACQLRVADDSAYFGLPEGQRGIFVGGGGSVRIPRLIGTSRMADMMLTGRVFDADEAERFGIVNYRVPAGAALGRAFAVARKMADNAPMTSFAVMQALPRIVEQAPAEGLFTEALMAALASSTPQAQERLQAFLQGRAAKVTKP